MPSLLVGRDRALEAFLTCEDCDADRAEQYGWVTRAVPDAELDDFVDAATLPGVRKRGLLVDRLLAEVGVDEIERTMGRYLGVVSERS